jgi:adenosylcobinamide-phosphate synthase
MILFELQLGAALFLDLLFGDPRWFPHPVRLIGRVCTFCETVYRKLIQSEFLAGLMTVLSVLVLTMGCTAFVLFSIASLSVPVAQGLAIFVLYTLLAARDLVAHSRAVYKSLQNTVSLESARQAVAEIVGRDTATLDRDGIVRACVETVAENMVDGVTAPLFYAVGFSFLAPSTGIDPLFLAVFGAAGYKAINTMDSMIGYKNDRYLFFGKTAARLDDLVNFIPARISGIILIPAALILKLDWRGAYLVFRQDRLSHTSPNAGHPEAAFAGALGVQLGGESSYFGEKVEKQVIGDTRREIEGKDILRGNNLMLLGSALFLIVLLVLRFLLLNILF